MKLTAQDILDEFSLTYVSESCKTKKVEEGVGFEQTVKDTEAFKAAKESVQNALVANTDIMKLLEEYYDDVSNATDDKDFDETIQSAKYAKIKKSTLATAVAAELFNR